MGGVHTPIGLLLIQSLEGETTDPAFGRLPQEKDVMAEDLLFPYSEWVQPARVTRLLLLATTLFFGSRSCTISIASRPIPQKIVFICFRDGVVKLSIACTGAW